MNSNGTPQRYPRAVGNQPQPELPLGRSFFDIAEMFKKTPPLKHTPSVDKFWNAGVNMAYGRRAAYPSSRILPAGFAEKIREKAKENQGQKVMRHGWGAKAGQLAKQKIGVEAYNRAKAHVDYGNPEAARAELGGFFDDVMTAIVPGWTARPEALKAIDLQVSPDRIFTMLNKISPNLGAKVVSVANKAGFGVFVNTPGGQVEVSPQTAQGVYAGLPYFTRAKSMVESVPMWVWLAGGAGVLALVMLRR